MPEAMTPTPKKIPTVADMVFALMTAPGFNDVEAEEQLKAAGRKNITSAFMAWLHHTDKKNDTHTAPGRVQGINVLIWGPPGCGKTQGTMKAIKAMGRVPWKKDLSRVSPEDLTGIPRPVKTRGGRMYTIKAPDLFFYNLSKAKNGVLVLDDLTNAAKLVQAGGLGLVLDREFDDGVGGSYYINNTPVVGMCNFGDSATTNELLTPMSNRFLHIFTGPKEDATTYWKNGQKSSLTLDRSLQDTLQAEWNERYMRALTLCSGFVWSYGDRVWDEEPSDFVKVQDHAWCSPRTLELAARAIAAAEHYGLDDKRFIEGAIGVPAARKLMDFRNSLRLPTVEQVYRREVNFRFMAPSGQVVLLQKAATECTNVEQLDAVLEAITTVRGLSSESDDLTILALEVLKRRMNGAVPTRPVDAAMRDRISKFVEPIVKKYRISGADLGSGGADGLALAS